MSKPAEYPDTCILCDKPTDLTENELKALEEGKNVVKICEKCKLERLMEWRERHCRTLTKLSSK